MKNLILAISALLAAVSAGTNACAAENVSVPGEYALLSTPASSEYPTLYYCYNDDADKFEDKNFSWLDYNAYNRGKLKYVKVPGGVDMTDEIFSTYDAGDYVYFVKFATQREINEYVSRYKQHLKDWGLTWQITMAICRVKKAAGYSEYFNKHFKKLDLNSVAETYLNEAKDENFSISYNFSNKALVLKDVTMKKEYEGADAIHFIESGDLRLTSKERKEKAAKAERKNNLMEQAITEWAYLKDKNIVKKWSASVYCNDLGYVVTEKDYLKGHWLYSKAICTIVYCGPSSSDITNIYVLPPLADEEEEYNYKHNGMWKVSSNQWLKKYSTSSKVAPPELIYITDEDYGFYTLNVRYNGERYDVPIHKKDVEILDKLLDSKANKTSVKHGRGIYIGVGTIGANGYQPIK